MLPARTNIPPSLDSDITRLSQALNPQFHVGYVRFCV